MLTLLTNFESILHSKKQLKKDEQDEQVRQKIETFPISRAEPPPESRESDKFTQIFKNYEDVSWSDIRYHFTTFDESESAIKKWCNESLIFESHPGIYRRL